jgi:hypothetical protein
MFDNQPELIRELLESHQIEQLEEILEANLVQAIRCAQALEKSGRNHHEAMEIASELILTPADGPAFSDKPPKPLSQKLRRRAYRELERRDEAERRERLLRAPAQAVFSPAILIAVIRADGTIEERNAVGQFSPPLNPAEATLAVEYFFKDWAENEDVVALCTKYLDEVEAIVADGLKRGFLTR